MSSFEGIGAAEIAEELKAAGAESRTEEDFKIRAEYILRVKAFEKFGRYEQTLEPWHDTLPSAFSASGLEGP